MAVLPDPTTTLTGEDLTTYQAMAAQRGEGDLGQVYVRMFNDPAVARLVGALGGHLRYGGTLPGDVRELVILHLARRMGIAYEWVHHVRPAAAAGLAAATVDALAAGADPAGLRADQRAALQAADAVYDLRSIPADAQDVIVTALGTPAVVELTALVGLYRLIGGMICAFDVSIEPDFLALVPAWARDEEGR